MHTVYVQLELWLQNKIETKEVNKKSKYYF